MASMALSLAFLAGCSGGVPASDGPATPVPAESRAGDKSSADLTPEATPEDRYASGTVNARGNLVKEIGQLAGLTSSDGETVADFTITAIDVGFTCTSDYPEPPAHGTFVAVTMDVTTTAALAEEPLPYFLVTADLFKVISPEGTTENDSAGVAAWTCLAPSDGIPEQIGPGEHAVGKVVLDTAHGSGSLVFTQPSVRGGWEWGF